jgi:hypothetical protein
MRRYYDVWRLALPFLSDRDLPRRLLVHVFLSVLRERLLHAISGLHHNQQLQNVLWERRPPRMLLPNAVWRLWRKNNGLVPRDHVLSRSLLMIHGAHAVGFTCLGLIVGLVALWSP